MHEWNVLAGWNGGLQLGLAHTVPFSRSDGVRIELGARDTTSTLVYNINI
jgi:hypothetical protein